MGRYNNSLNENKYEESNWVGDRKRHQDLIKKWYSRIQKISKKSAKIFFLVVICGRHSGGGKVVLDFYDGMTKL